MRVLLVDHDSEGLEAISRAIRGVLELDCVSSKSDALLLLRQNTYDVLIACERCVDGSGLDLLGRTTRTAVPLKRIFAAAPERLQLLGPRLAPFKVQRTINYPIDLEELWLAIAQVTGDPNDETDGTIERVVLDERGIPAIGSQPRAPIPPRPPAPLAAVPPPPAPVPAAIAASAGGGRATARLSQPAPEPPLRAPPRVPPRVTEMTAPLRTPEPVAAPRPANGAAARVPMRAAAPALQPLAPMPVSGDIPEPRGLPEWTPEPAADDFAAVAEQARMGIQQKTVSEAERRRKLRLLAACGIAVAVAGVIVFAIEKFYDPDARARERAIAAEVSRMAEQQKVTDSITMIEVDIETAIMNNDLEVARRELATLVQMAPDHPRREFLRASIDRAAELARLAPQARAAAPAAEPAPRAAEPEPRPRTERPVERAPERQVARNDRPAASRPAADNTPAPRVYGAPIGEAPRARLPLDAPINTPPSTTFSGRTVEAGDPPLTRAPAPAPAQPPPATTTSVAPAPVANAGSAAVVPASAPPAAAPPVDVVPAKIVKRVTPVAPGGIPRRTKGYVVVVFDISESGKVTGVDVVESEPRGVFDDAATTAVRKWVYEPRKENGVAVASQGRARLVFEEAT
jgi:protein TonB